MLLMSLTQGDLGSASNLRVRFRFCVDVVHCLLGTVNNILAAPVLETILFTICAVTSAVLRYVRLFYAHQVMSLLICSRACLFCFSMPRLCHFRFSMPWRFLFICVFVSIFSVYARYATFSLFACAWQVFSLIYVTYVNSFLFTCARSVRCIECVFNVRTAAGSDKVRRGIKKHYTKKKAPHFHIASKIQPYDQPSLLLTMKSAVFAMFALACTMALPMGVTASADPTSVPICMLGKPNVCLKAKHPTHEAGKDILSLGTAASGGDTPSTLKFFGIHSKIGRHPWSIHVENTDKVPCARARPVECTTYA